MDTNSSSKTKIGVLLVGHGSRLPYGKDVVSQIADMYREDEGRLVEVGFMNMSKPSIPEAINSLAQQGAEKIIVTPVFLAHGVHTTEDIPRILGLNNGHGDNMDTAMDTVTAMKMKLKLKLILKVRLSIQNL